MHQFSVTVLSKKNNTARQNDFNDGTQSKRIIPS